MSDDKVNLSKRIRANSEAAPWVIDEVKAMEEEIEQLRAELTAAKANTEELKKDLYGLQQAAIRLGDRLDDAEKELAAAKAASVLPVEIESVYVNKYLGSVVVFIGHEKGAVEFDAWLCDRVKERGER